MTVPAQNAGMHILVLGCGRTGSELALSLDGAGHSVAIVDRDRGAFRRLPERFTGRAVLGNCINQAVLEQAGIGDAVAVAAVTSGDNSNIVAARISREHYEIKNVVARIKDPRRAEIYQRLGIPTVATLTWTTNQVLRRLFPGDNEIDWTHPSGTMHLVERDLPDGWAGHRLDALGENERFRLVAVTRAGEAKLAGPGLVGQEGDLLHVLVHEDATNELEQLLAQGGANP